MANTLKFFQLTLKLLSVLLLFALVPFPSTSRNRLSMIFATPTFPSVVPRSLSDYRSAVAKQINSDAETIDPEFVPFNTDSFFLDETTKSTSTSQSSSSTDTTHNSTTISIMPSTRKPFISISKVIKTNLWNWINIGRFFSFKI